MDLSERFDIDVEHLECYDILDRKPIIFEKEKHISNIISKINIFFSKTLPCEIIYKISEYIFYNSKEINLKILDFLIKKNANTNLLENFILTNNKNNYISSILFKINYNTIFYNCPTSFGLWVGSEKDEYPLNIFNYDIKNKNLLILINLNSCQNFFEDRLVGLKNKVEINNNIIEEVETCFDYKGITNPNTRGYFYIDEDINEEIIEVQNDEYFVNFNINEYIYKLIENNCESDDDNYMYILIFKNKIISFDCGWCNLGIDVEEIKEDGYIVAPEYNIHDILKMERWNIEEIIKYNFIIKSRRSFKNISR